MKNNKVNRKNILFAVSLTAILTLIILIYFLNRNDNENQTTSEAAVNTQTHPETMTVEVTTGETTTVEPTTEEVTIEETILQETTIQETIQQTDNNIIQGRVVVIDAGHQLVGNSEKEPIGPGSAELKAKVTSGTTGVSTGIPEYELNLSVALKLKEELINRGFNVIMVRETNDVDISNSERANVANNAKADAFIRIHADSSENSSVTGTMTISPTPNNPFCSQIYQQSKSLSSYVLNGIVEMTGSKNRGVWETDTMSGINWCEVPVTIVEMGFMSNPDEDYKMSTQDYQNKIVQGIANGINCYFMETN